MRWMHRVRLYPTVAHERRLWFMLDLTRQKYNALLDVRAIMMLGSEFRTASPCTRENVLMTSEKLHMISDRYCIPRL